MPMENAGKSTDEVGSVYQAKAILIENDLSNPQYYSKIKDSPSSCAWNNKSNKRNFGF